MNSSSAQEQAIEWLVRLQTAENIDRHWPEFEKWLDQDQRHSEIYAKVEHMWSDPEFLKELVRKEEHRSRNALIDAMTRESKRRRFNTAVRAAGLALLMGGAATLLMEVFGAPVHQPDWAVYERKTDQVTPVALGGGSSVQLNHYTQIRIGIRGDEREILLDNGEAYFDVQPRVAEVLNVDAGAVVIRSQNAAFSIKKEGDGHIETVVRRGEVEITSNKSGSPSAAPPSHLYLEVSEGELAMVSPSNHLDVVTINSSELERRLAWTNNIHSSDASDLTWRTRDNGELSIAHSLGDAGRLASP